jgi:hypothetical protein
VYRKDLACGSLQQTPPAVVSNQKNVPPSNTEQSAGNFIELVHKTGDLWTAIPKRFFLASALVSRMRNPKGFMDSSTVECTYHPIGIGKLNCY